MRKTLIGLLFLLSLLAATAATATTASAKQLSLQQLKAQLRSAKLSRSRAAERLAAAAANVGLAETLRADAPSALTSATAATSATADTVGASLGTAQTQLAAALLADGVVTDGEVANLVATEIKARQSQRYWATRVSLLQRQVTRRLQIINWNRRGQWTPLIKIASSRYKVSAAGLRRLMLLESGGNRYAGSAYKGLFQYAPSTWRGTWNPWRHDSIYNGWAQIQATALALRKGMGPGHWPNTYWRAF